ncbi:MAG: septum formation initiator family protein [Aquificaceae bacterium]|nr:septum formation initiator family protein [Aquificaceae bacterium]MDW8096112.1 septum formation initiator family protein [Aquificaceae bacterium]
MKRSLVVKKNSSGLKPDTLIKSFAFLLFIYTCYNIFLSQYSIFKVFELKKASHHIQLQVNHQKEENHKKEQLLELVKEHPEHFKEKFAREYMQMQKEGEYILILRD